MNSIKTRLLVVFILIFLPFAITVGLAFNTFNSLGDDGVAINLSGSQRMRTMLISNYSLQVYNGDDSVSELETAKEYLETELPKYEKIMNGLINGDESLNIGPNQNAEIVSAIKAVQSKTGQLVTAANKVVAGTATDEDMKFIVVNTMPVKNEIHAIVGMYQSGYDKKISNFKTIILFMVAFGILMLVVGIVYGNRVIARPILQLTNILKDISEGDGDLTKRAYINSKDEIGVMAEYFNKFADSVHEIVSNVTTMSQHTVESSSQVLKVLTLINQGSEEIANATNDVAEGASEQSGKVQMTMQSIQHNHTLVNQGYESIQETENIADQAKHSAKNGVEAINEAIKQFESISRTINFAKDSIEKLNMRTNEIGDIVTVISGISAQTNLLALNASIEAARAGEHGRGFAVVAEEVRKLAEESESATTQIATLISDIQVETSVNVNTMGGNVTSVANQVDVVNKGSEALNEMNNAINMTTDKIDELSCIFDGIVKESSQITEVFDQVMTITETTSASSEEVAASIEEQLTAIGEATELMEMLSNEANELKVTMEKFQI